MTAVIHSSTVKLYIYRSEIFWNIIRWCICICWRTPSPWFLVVMRAAATAAAVAAPTFNGSWSMFIDDDDDDDDTGTFVDMFFLAIGSRRLSLFPWRSRSLHQLLRRVLLLRTTTMCHFDSERTSNDPNVELFKASRGIELCMSTQWDTRHTSFHRVIYANKIRTIITD